MAPPRAAPRGRGYAPYTSLVGDGRLLRTPSFRAALGRRWYAPRLWCERLPVGIVYRQIAVKLDHQIAVVVSDGVGRPDWVGIVRAGVGMVDDQVAVLPHDAAFTGVRRRIVRPPKHSLLRVHALVLQAAHLEQQHVRARIRELTVGGIEHIPRRQPML